MKHSSPRMAMLIIDMINDFSFEDGQDLLASASHLPEKISILKKQLKSHHVPIIYVNDNYGRWQSDFKDLYSHCLQQQGNVREFNEMIKPEDDDYFVLKPQFSGFYATPLDILLRQLDVQTLLICGIAGNMCVHFTANDAYMRKFKLFIPSDLSASLTEEENDQAISIMSTVLRATTTPSDQLVINSMLKEADDYYERTI
ncbi:isochorismatase family cysteine hydrolase [Geomicrobium sp. JCM 19038]|uniref:isochorismatase family cysteine hydrolase n=1 Tax=Geomicrobium sp. JCM 19038 TaxID=1460635 RepID=UPI00045F3C1B|nr:isochorismatase family cysteine hydrolase [Geomicrobium sp. JCM 19038]GAK08584.1 nicotinamidase [Geomicrobium sp. JCM 19038]